MSSFHKTVEAALRLLQSAELDQPALRTKHHFERLFRALRLQFDAEVVAEVSRCVPDPRVANTFAALAGADFMLDLQQFVRCAPPESPAPAPTSEAAAAKPEDDIAEVLDELSEPLTPSATRAGELEDIRSLLAAVAQEQQQRFALLLLGHYMLNSFVLPFECARESARRFVAQHYAAYVEAVDAFLFGAETLDDVLDSMLFFVLARLLQAHGAHGASVALLMNHYKLRQREQNDNCVATIVNQAVFAHLALHNYHEAQALLEVTTFPANVRGYEQICKHLYFKGCLALVGDECQQAKEWLHEVALKLPKSDWGSRFAQLVFAKLVIAQLSRAQIPNLERFSAFKAHGVMRAFFELTLAVYDGKVEEFKRVSAQYAAVFCAYEVKNPVERLYSTVVRRGLIRINKAYCRLALADIQRMLCLSGLDETVSVIMQAIADGAICASLDSERLVLDSHSASLSKGLSALEQTLSEKIEKCKQLCLLAAKNVSFSKQDNLQAKILASEKKNSTLSVCKSVDCEFSDSEA